MINMNNPVAMAQEIAQLRAINAELLAALRRATRQVEFDHLYLQRAMPAADAVEVAETLAECRAAIAKAKEVRS